MNRKTRPKLTRRQALDGRPAKMPLTSEVPVEKGGKRLGVKLKRAGWERWVAGAGYVERKFELDSFGVEVYDACDGKTSVSDIIKKFAQAHNLSIAEAEMSVTQFLEMLMKRGLVAVSVNLQENRT